MNEANMYADHDESKFGMRRQFGIAVFDESSTRVCDD